MIPGFASLVFCQKICEFVECNYQVIHSLFLLSSDTFVMSITVLETQRMIL